MNFGQAINAMQLGAKVLREGWNGKGMWLIIVRDWNCVFGAWGALDEIERAPFIAMKTANNKFVPWLASQTDMLADDWKVLL